MNILQTILAIAQNPISQLQTSPINRNRIISVGDALELYIKDAFSNSVTLTTESEKLENYSQHFSYSGNSSQPPDLMLRDGDAIEIKKLEKSSATIALNSSYPKDKLHADSRLINETCRTCEKWDVKDMLYIIGHVTERTIKTLWFVYGDCFIANRSIYEGMQHRISEGLQAIEGIQFSATKELGRVNKVDPLGITDLRLRGMWQIQHPSLIFKYLNLTDGTSLFELICIMTNRKFESFPVVDQQNLINSQSGTQVIDIRIKSPNNPVKLLDAKAILYQKGRF